MMRTRAPNKTIHRTRQRRAPVMVGVMHNKSHIETGRYKNYFWLTCHTEIANIDKLIIEYHKGYTLYLTTFDSGPLIPTQEELDQGWEINNEIMISPPLSSKTFIPHEQYDEWYLSKENSCII